MPRSLFRLLHVAAGLAALLACGSRPAEAYTPAEGKAPMTVTLVRSDAKDCGADCPEWLALTGEILPATPALLMAALARIGPRHIPILVDSPGGAVEPALAMGRAIRARRLDVIVAGTALSECGSGDRACMARRRAGESPGFVAGGIAACASACALLLAAGTERVVGQNSYVGVHQMSARRTFTQTRTLYRVLRRREGGRLVEVSRTPISTQTISTRTVATGASEATYSQVDRYLLGMGIGETIMPLMRSAPPSGIHWMTPGELAGTHLSNDTTDATTMVGRSPRSAARAGPGPSAMALASARIGPGPRVAGIVDWSIAPEPGGPALLGTIDVPQLHLHGTVTLRRVTGPGNPAAYAMTVDLGAAGDIDLAHDWLSQSPRLCDASTCVAPFWPTATEDDGHGRRVFGLAPARDQLLLAALRDRDGFSIPLQGEGGGEIVLSLRQGARAIVVDWEHQCCGLAAAAGSEPGLQDIAFTAQADVTLVDPRAGTTLGTAARLSWTVQGRLDRPGAPGEPMLRGSLRVPMTDLGLSVAVAPTGGPDLVTVVVTVASPTARFGPAREVKVPVVWSANRHVALLTESSGPTRDGQGFRAVLSIGDDLPEGASLALDMTDAVGRSLTVAIPTDGPLRTVFRAVRLASGSAT